MMQAPMEQTRRFVFRGNASSYGGQVYRRDDQTLRRAAVLMTGATSSLNVLGGASSGESRATKFLDGFVRVGNASTEATAQFDDFKQAAAVSRGELQQETLTGTTKVMAWVEDLVIGKEPKALKGKQPAGREKEPRLSVGWVGGSLISATARGSEEPAIRLVGRETDIKKVFIDGYELKVTLNKAEFEALDTMSKLHTAANDQTFIERTGDCMFRGEKFRAAGVAAGAVRPASTLGGTLVKRLEWAKGQKHPDATIEHNSVIVPDFGVVYFGEIFVTAESRRVTMLRVKFGSPVGGGFACSEFETNGSWFPPVP